MPRSYAPATRLDICSTQVSPGTNDLEKTIIAGAVGTTRARVCMFMYDSIRVHFIYR